MTDIDLDELAARHARAQAEAEATAAELAAREQAMLEAQAARRAEWDRQFVDSYRDRIVAIENRTREVQSAFRDAVLSTPLVEAWIDLRADRWRRMVLANAMAGSLVRLGREQEAARYPSPDWREPRLLEDLVEYADQEAQARAEDEVAALDQQREEHAAGTTT